MEHIIDEIIANCKEDEPIIRQEFSAYKQKKEKEEKLETEQFIEEFLQKTDEETRERIKKYLL